jgi:hypothetical protein
VVPHRSTNQTRTCLTSLSRREAVLSCWYGRSQYFHYLPALYTHSTDPRPYLYNKLILYLLRILYLCPIDSPTVHKRGCTKSLRTKRCRLRVCALRIGPIVLLRLRTLKRALWYELYTNLLGGQFFDEPPN